MLILERSKGESIIIGNDITITLLNTKGGQASIGIDAPRKVTVHREEVYKKILKEKEEKGDKDITT